MFLGVGRGQIFEKDFLGGQMFFGGEAAEKFLKQKGTPLCFFQKVVYFENPKDFLGGGLIFSKDFLGRGQISVTFPKKSETLL